MCEQLLCRAEWQIPTATLYHTEFFLHMLLYISHCLPAMLAYTTKTAKGNLTLEVSGPSLGSKPIHKMRNYGV